jgi:hypothetical protein
MKNSIANPVTVNGKVFSIYAPIAFVRAERDGNGGFVPGKIDIGLDYCATRNGEGVEEFGPIRSAYGSSKPKSVGAQLVVAAAEVFNADYDAMRAEVQRRLDAGELWPRAPPLTHPWTRGDIMANTTAPATEAQINEQANAIATLAASIANGTLIGPRYAAAKRLRDMVDTLEAWVGDDR